MTILKAFTEMCTVMTETIKSLIKKEEVDSRENSVLSDNVTSRPERKKYREQGHRQNGWVLRWRAEGA